MKFKLVVALVDDSETDAVLECVATVLLAALREARHVRITGS